MRILIITEHLYIARSMERDCSENIGSAEVRTVCDLQQLNEVCADFRPEVIAFDGVLLSEFGRQLVQGMREKAGNSVKILGFGMGCDYVMAWLIRQTALAGYLLLENTEPSELTHAITRLRNDERVFSPRVGKMLEDQRTCSLGAFKKLTETQQLLLGLIGCGLNNAEIAQVLGFRVQSIKNQQTRIAKLFDIKSSAKLVRFAMEMGFATYALGGNPMRSRFRLQRSQRMVSAVRSYMWARIAGGNRKGSAVPSVQLKKAGVENVVYYQSSPVTVRDDPLDKMDTSEMNDLAPHRRC